MPDNKGGIPKTVKIGEVEYVLADHPELLALVQAGRKDEKDKLYATIQGHEASIKVLQDEKKKFGELTQADKDALKKATDELAVAKAELEKLGGTPPAPAKPKDKKETDTGITTDDVQKLITDALAKQADEHKKQLDEVSGKLNTKSVEDYRKEMLEKHKGNVIADLIPEGLGSVEDVNKAVEKALETSKQFIRKDYEVEEGKTENLTLAEIEERELAKKATPPAPAPTPTYTGAGAPPTPPSGGGDLTGKELVKDLGKMSQSEFEKNREAIKKEIQQVGYGEQS